MYHICFERNAKDKLNYDNRALIIQELNRLKDLEDLAKNANVKAWGGRLYLYSKPRFRIILYKYEIDDRQVLFVRDFYTDIEEFDRKQYFKLRDYYRKLPIDNSDVEQCLKAMSREQVLEAEEPPQELTSWLYEFSFNFNNSVFEFDWWVKYTLEENVKRKLHDTDLGLFGSLLRKILFEPQALTENKPIVRGIIDIYQAQSEGVALFYSKITLQGKDIVIIYAGCNTVSQKEYCQEVMQQLKDMDLNFATDIDSISRRAYRAYPAWTVKDSERIKNFWEPIEKNSELDNLSLLKEQIEILQNLNTRLPIYIKGQAGSGKSTLLYYIFANLYYLIVGNAAPVLKNRVLFLSENQQLLKRTKEIIRGMLLNNPEWKLSVSDLDGFDTYFSTLKDFLRQLLTERDKELFPEDKYLSFAEFKRLYYSDIHLRRIAENISAEEAWYTITTFIYGYDIKRVYKSDSYSEISRRFRNIIPKERYRRIEKTVLPFYEKLINEQGYWDKLKIIRHITQNYNDLPNYVVIICDEAQDFTKAEIQFLLRQSVFSQYNLEKTHAVPIILAGDQNQTVSPTGYRDVEITALLYEELSKLNFSRSDEDRSMIYESFYNYRSVEHVVHLANFIQYFRKKKLGMEIEKPQRPKRLDSEFNFNLFYSFDFLKQNPDFTEQMRKLIRYKLFIIPVDLFQKQKYIKSQPLLVELADKEDLIRTAVETKGIDYKYVVLYGFGDYFLREIFNQPIDQINISDDDKAFEIKYFFNKLYVAVTRAQKELIIIDSAEAWKKFWQPIQNIKFTDEEWKWLEQKSSSLFAKEVPHTNIIEAKQENVLEIAEREEQAGRAETNPERLKLAANLFAKYGHEIRAKNILAFAEELVGNYANAIKLYEEIENYDEISRLLFKLKDFDRLLNLPTDKMTDKASHQIRIIFTKILRQETVVNSDIQMLNQSTKLVSAILSDLSWYKDILQALLQQQIHNQWTAELIIRFMLQYDFENSFAFPTAELALKYEKYKEAIQVLEKAELTDNVLYYKAQLELHKQKKNFVEAGFWAFKILEDEPTEQNLNQLREIVENISNYHKDEVTMAEALLVKVAFFQESDEETIVELINHIEDVEYPDSWYKNVIDLLSELGVGEPMLLTFLIERWAKFAYKAGYDLDSINNIYHTWAEKFGIEFQPFTEQELGEPPKPVQQLPINYPARLQSLVITNFRQFSSLVVDNLGQFNLIVGDNNAGKTSLLEALVLNDDLEYSAKALAQLYLKRTGEYELKPNFYESYFNMGAERFELTAKQGRFKWKVQYEKQDFDLELSSKQVQNLIIPFIPFGRENLKKIARFYFQKIFVETRKRRELLDVMKIFIPDLTLISVDTEDNTILVETEKSEYAEPISNFGEGAYKLFQILTYLYYFKNSRILIDEIDSGIHYSHFGRFWEAILKIANETNTQIFATTHNIECIQYFNHILSKPENEHLREKARVITLYKFPEQKFKAYVYKFEEFNYLVENNYEIRGEKL